ncbi:flagellar biosynthesis protein FlhB [Undibacterium macrobrachii]|jgi:flagellar biosynthetic protein FlhB|uniref:Flagellar biosynthetic protein FlhB n=1 Tax=Undibacterium macrobrachii TaxID=1119058 RepID=A0ABQ2X626_9BURK|nr:flagellar biosynthesis protein FlhB [Undibacterium macrobrachii]GGX01002.1 flagellar biosynthesis protein FlhB [Undibacterium macrobrachii]
MAEDSGLERTEPASPQRLEKAREEGDVPRSRELSTCTVLLAAGGGLYFYGETLFHNLAKNFSRGLSFERSAAFDANFLTMQIIDSVVDVMLAFLPIVGLLLLAAVGSPLLIGGWLFSFKSLEPKFSRLNPIAGMGNLVSSRSAVELVKAILKTILVGAIAWLVVAQQKDAIFGLINEPLDEASAHLGRMLGVCFLAIVGGLVLIAVIDAPYQMWAYAEKLKMTHQEVIQESKEANGNPQIKAKIRQQQREMARRRMMAEIPTADVVVTNPTHFSVALKYADGSNGAPRVIAKGADVLAAKIRELAKENNVPILEAPPLARALYKHTELGDEIPESLYAAVAEILAYVFQLRSYRKSGGIPPVEPKNIQVPTGLDPLSNEGGVVV